MIKKIREIQTCNSSKIEFKTYFVLAPFLSFVESGSAKNAESLIKQDYNKCKQVFIDCSKFEDEAVKYMVQCYTSESQIKANIKELLVIKDAATKLKINQEAVVSSSTSKNSAKAAGKHIREKRQKNSVSVSCSTYITEVETVDKLFT